MNRRKALSLLLAASMIFTMNSVAFAAEETTDNVETIETQVVYKDDAEKEKALGQSTNEYGGKTYKTSSENSKVLETAFKAGIALRGIRGTTTATGSKIKGTAFTGTKKTGFRMYVSANGYRTSVKSVKITSNAKDCGSEISYKISALNGAQFVEKYDPTSPLDNDRDGFISLQPKDAKEGFKALKNSLSTIKGYEFKAVIVPQRLTGAVSDNYVKSLGKTVSAGDIDGSNGSGYDLTEKVVVTTKGGAVKKVQVVEPQYIKSTDSEWGNLVQGTYAKLKLRTLKKNKDYTLSGNTVVIDNSKVFYTYSDELKNFEAKW